MRHTAKIKKRKPFNTFMLHSKSTYFYKHKWSSPLIPASCCIALLIMIGITINPVISSSREAYAESTSPQSDSDLIPEKGVALRIDTTLNDKDTVEEQVSGTGTQYIKVDFTVGANNIQNYDVYVQADSTALTGTSHGDKLQSINGNSVGTVGAMQWGYSVERGSVEPSTMTYKPIQTSAATSADGQDAGEGKTLTGISQPYTLAFAANLEGAASDHYKSNITLSVAAGATETTKTGLGFNGITEMQQMTSDVCSSAADGLEGRLKDTRDDKVYWVGKLKDGNCWMTQNLDLDLFYNNFDRVLTPLDSDVINNWKTNSSVSQIWNGGDNANTHNLVRYYDPGLFVYTTPRLIDTCTRNSAGLSTCIGNHWVNVSAMTPFNEITPKDVIDYTSHQYNAHYLAGNYYSWDAATATDLANSSENGAIAKQSICPKGWMLPNIEIATNLITNLTAIPTLIENNATLAPYYFLRNGYISSSFLNGAGNEAYYWLSDLEGATAANYLFLQTGIYATNSFVYSRSMGMSVRCVAR